MSITIQSEAQMNIILRALMFVVAVLMILFSTLLASFGQRFDAALFAVTAVLLFVVAAIVE